MRAMAFVAKKHLVRLFSGRDEVKQGSTPQKNTPITLADESDENLMLAYQNGREDAFGILLSRHKKPLYGFLRRSLKNHEQAEEAFQEVFLKLVRHCADYKVTAKFTTWLYTLARNHCIDLARKARFRQYLSLDRGLEDEKTRATFERFLVSESSTDSESSVRELQEHLQAILEALNPDQREVFLLREFQGLAFDEIAKVTKVSTNTVKSRMRYALEAIHKKFAELGIFSTISNQ